MGSTVHKLRSGLFNSSSPRSSFLPLSFESLQAREMMTGNIDPGIDSTETFSLAANETHDSVLLTNESTITARFTMRFNGNISVNTQDLVEQIRAYEVPGEPDMPDYEKAYHYLMEFHSHDRPVSGKTWMHEPSLYLNSIGAGLCDDAASALKLIWNAMGYEARVWLLSGHVVSEVYTGERWEMYDADLRLVYYNDDMQVAGVEELMQNPHYIYSPKVRFDQADGSGVSHSKRTASFYWTTENNRVCTACTTNLEQRDLVFEIPAGGTLRVGELTPEREIPSSAVKASSLGLVTITIPANSTGSLNIPLALYDVTGGRRDNIRIGATRVSLGTDEAFANFNRDTTDARFQTISYENNAEPIQVHYLMNRNYTEVLAQNTIEINHVGDTTDLTAEVASPLAKRWEFPTVQAGTSTGQTAAQTKQYFDGENFYEVDDPDVAALLHGEKNFEIEARVKVDAADGTRRPVADMFRLSFEIDSANRPYVYYRASNNRWVGVRGAQLPSNEWVDLGVRYEDGKLTLLVNGQVQGARVGSGFHRGYLVQDLKIGGSDHSGGLRFKGEIAELSIRGLADHPFAFQTTAVDQAFAEGGETATEVQPEPVAGDLNDDGKVTFDDFLLFVPNFGKEGVDLAGDFDANGKVDYSDFLFLIQAFMSSSERAAQ